jgi:transposase-like protein
MTVNIRIACLSEQFVADESADQQWCGPIAYVCGTLWRRVTRAGGWMKRTLTSKEEIAFLYRAVDSTGQTMDFLLTARRNAAAAKRFFPRALWNDNPMPRVINVDKNPAYPRAVTELKADGTINRRCRLPNASI